VRSRLDTYVEKEYECRILNKINKIKEKIMEKETDEKKTVRVLIMHSQVKTWRFYRLQDLMHYAESVSETAFTEDILQIVCANAIKNKSMETAIYRRIAQCYPQFKNHIRYIDLEHLGDVPAPAPISTGLYVTEDLMYHIHNVFNRKHKVCDIELWSSLDGKKLNLTGFKQVSLFPKGVDVTVPTLAYLTERIPAIKKCASKIGTVVSDKSKRYTPPEVPETSVPVQQELPLSDKEQQLIRLGAENKELQYANNTFLKTLEAQREHIVKLVRQIALNGISKEPNKLKDTGSMFFHMAWTEWHKAVYEITGLCLKRTSTSLKKYEEEARKNNSACTQQDHEGVRGASYIDDLIIRKGWGPGLLIAFEAVLKLKEKSG